MPRFCHKMKWGIFLFKLETFRALEYLTASTDNELPDKGDLLVTFLGISLLLLDLWFILQNINEELDEFIDITIPESQKIGDGMGAYVAYKVVTRTNIPIFKKKTMCVMRRFSDFLGLHDKLTEKYLRIGRIIPPAPEKSVIGMTKIKMSNQEQAGSGDFVERRKQSLERYVRRTAKHPVLRVDPDVREFLESGKN